MAPKKNSLVYNAALLDRYGIDLNRYVIAMARSRKVLQRYRQERRDAVRQAIGAHYADDGPSTKVPVDLIGMYERIVGTALISSHPRYSLTTFQAPLKAAVSAMEVWMNRQVERMGLAATLKRIVTDSLYSIGIAKVALATPTDSALLAWGPRAGEPLVSPIDLDDFVYDTQAHRFEETAFIGHRFRVPLDAVKDGKFFNPKLTKTMEPTVQSRYNLEGDERISQIGVGLWWNTDDAEDMTDLWEIYLPRHRLVITLANDAMAGPALVQSDGIAEPLRVQRWVGPDKGPYHLLGHRTVGGNAMPLGPILQLVDLHESANRTYRKLMAQADRQKSNLWYSNNDTDAARVMQCNDGDVVPVNRPDMLKQTNLGGPDPGNMQFFLQCQQLFSWASGNLDVMGGLGPQAKTLGQERLLEDSSSRVISGMQATTADYVEQIGKALAWYWWHDPYTVMQAPYSPKGVSELQVNRQVYPADDQLKQLGQLTRHGRFEDLDLKIDPYSLRHQTPAEKLQAITQLVTGIIIPLMPILAQQGISFDIVKFLKLVSKYSNMPEVEEIVTIGQVAPPNPDQAPGGGGEGPAATKPAETTRSYERINRSERTQQGTNHELMLKLAGMNPGGNRDSAQVS